jgi:hypothetical protein
MHYNNYKDGEKWQGFIITAFEIDAEIASRYRKIITED